MPKMKSHSGLSKRVKVTGSGKLVKEQANRRHKLEVKSSRRKRRLAGTDELTGGDRRQAKRLLRPDR